MDKIVEFEPVELIIVDDIKDLPDEYMKLLKKWVKLKYGYQGDKLAEVFDFGDEMRIIHYEWKYNGEYYLVIDFVGYPDGEEHGFVALADDIVFEIDSIYLKPLNKNSPLYSRLESFEHLRLLECDGVHKWCDHIYDIYEELKEDLEEEEVSEDEFTAIVKEPYTHFSEDDASGVDSEN